MWTQMTVSVSFAGRQIGSQKGEASGVKPSLPGSSGKLTALKPRSALRRISAAATSASWSHGIWQGISRSGWAPAHSSMCQSFHALTVASA